MRYSFISAAILALTSSVFAQTANFDPISIPTQDQQVAAGSTLDITWEPSTVHTGTITIQLLQGATSSTLEIGQTITAGLDQNLGKYSWTVPTSLESFATYGFKITLDSTASSASPIFQFSFPFHITGLGSTSSTGYSTSPVATTTVHLSTGTGYSVQSTSSSSSSYSTSVNSTTSCSTTSYSAKPTGYSASTTLYGTGNITLSTIIKPTVSSTGSSAGSSASSPSSTSTSTTPQATANNAVTNMARGGVAVLGGLVLAFAL